MAALLHYYAHPGQRFSQVNSAMWRAAQTVEGITSVDLYRDYPRHIIDVGHEQGLIADHDAVLLQFPLFWYSSPSLLKEWIDLVFADGFAYGEGGDKLRGKRMMLAVTASASQQAYSPEGYQHYPLRTFLTPFEQTARLSMMRFGAPYVMFDALKAAPGAHAAGFARLLAAIRDDHFDWDRAEQAEILTHDTLPLTEKA